MTMGSNGTLEFIESLAAPLGIVLGAMVLLGIALVAVRYLTNCQDDKDRAFAQAKSSAGKILAVGVASALLLNKDLAVKAYQKLTDGALSSVSTSASGEGQNDLMPDGGKFGVNSATQSKAAIIKEKGSTYVDSYAESEADDTEVSTWNSGVSSAAGKTDFKRLCWKYEVTTYQGLVARTTPGTMTYSEDLVKELRAMGVTDYSEGGGLKEILDDHNDTYQGEQVSTYSAAASWYAY